LILAITVLLFVGTQASSKQDIKEIPNATSISALTGDKSLKSNAGSEILVYSFAPESKAPAFRFLMQGGMHGNESQASQFVLWIAKRYARGESLLNQLSTDDIAIDFVPYLNPDGVTENNRYNARGVNLNRNFDVLWGITRENPGQKSFSEPETKALRKLFEKQKYTAAVDVHGYINWIVAPSAPEALKVAGHKVSKRQIGIYNSWTQAIRKNMTMLQGYQYKTGAELGDGGAFEDWAFWKHNTLSYCLELETWFRFVPSKKRQFNDLHQPTYGKVDKYAQYETFVYRMFQEAIAIKKAGTDPSQMAAN
jgi:hypothetical protein